MKKNICVSISKENYHKLNVISSIRKFFFREHDASISAIIEHALNEYFDTHEKEITELMERYHQEGGCATL